MPLAALKKKSAPAKPVAKAQPISAAPLLSPPARMQARLEVGPAGDRFEQEADRTADSVMRMPDPTIAIAPAPLQISRKCEVCEREEKDDKRLQKKSAGPAEANIGEAPASVHAALRSPGQPLDKASRAYFEPRFGQEFSDIRVHTGMTAAQSARDVSAHAYTVGQNIVFAAGRFAPATQTGRRLIAHELTHVVQQQGLPQVIRRAPANYPSNEPPSRTDGLTASEWARIREVRRFYNLPDRPTESQATIVGILILAGGEEVRLKSGEEGGVGGGTHRGGIPRGRGEAFSGGGMSQGNIASHIEGHAAAIMHQRDISEATLLIEAPPCNICDSPHGTANITRALPPGAKLTIIDPETAGTYWSSQRPPQATGGKAPVTSTPTPPTSSQGSAGEPTPKVSETTSGTQITESRGAIVEPINVPEPVGRIGAIKAGAETVGTMLLATLLNRLRSAELQKAVDRLKELIPEIDTYRKAGNDVIVTMVVEVPNQVDIAALIAGIGTQDQVVYFKRMFISSAVKHYSTPPAYTTMTANLASGDPEQRDPHEYTLEQQIKLQMGEKYPVPGTEPQKGFHFVSADLPLPAFTAVAQTAGPAAVEPGALHGIAGRYSAKFESIFVGSAFLIPFLVNRYLQVDQDSGKLTPKMWQPGPTPFSYLPYASHGHMVISGRFALGQGIPPDATWIYSNMEYPREGLILEWVKGMDAGLNTTWDALVSWHKVS